MKDAESSIKSLLSSLCEQARQLLDASIASIYLRKGKKLILKAFSSDDPNHIAPIDVTQHTIGKGIIGHIGTGDPFRGNFEDIWNSPYRMGNWDSPTPKMTLNVLGVPIFLAKKAVGVLKVESNKDGKVFTESSQRLLETIAELIAITLKAEPEIIATFLSFYIFVLMPFAEQFRDVYELGIKATAEKLRMRIERVDELEFNDSILSQIYSGIQRADFVIADMTGCNPNVFYEMGYAHASSKQVVTLVKKDHEIPFDLKGHNHIIYENITQLRQRLEKRLLKLQASK